MQENNFDIINTQNDEVKTAFISFIERVFKGKPYYSALKGENKNLNNKFDKMNDLANKLVAKHMLQKMVAENRKNPKAGFKINPDDYSMAFLANASFEEDYYQTFSDKIFSFIKKYIRATKTYFAVYSNIFATIYSTSKDYE